MPEWVGLVSGHRAYPVLVLLGLVIAAMFPAVRADHGRCDTYGETSPGKLVSRDFADGNHSTTYEIQTDVQDFSDSVATSADTAHVEWKYHEAKRFTDVGYPDASGVTHYVCKIKTWYQAVSDGILSVSLNGGTAGARGEFTCHFDRAWSAQYVYNATNVDPDPDPMFNPVAEPIAFVERGEGVFLVAGAIPFSSQSSACKENVELLTDAFKGPFDISSFYREPQGLDTGYRGQPGTICVGVSSLSEPLNLGPDEIGDPQCAGQMCPFPFLGCPDRRLIVTRIDHRGEITDPQATSLEILWDNLGSS